MTNEPHASEAPQGPLRRIIGAVLGILHTRLELLGIELSEEKTRLVGAMAFGFAAMLFGSMAFVLITFLIVALFWDSHRWEAIGILSASYLLIAILCALIARHRLLSAPLMFQSTLAELEKDRELFKH